jgi:hypothetical protein
VTEKIGEIKKYYNESRRGEISYKKEKESQPDCSHVE